MTPQRRPPECKPEQALAFDYCDDSGGRSTSSCVTNWPDIDDRVDEADDAAKKNTATTVRDRQCVSAGTGLQGSRAPRKKDRAYSSGGVNSIN